MSVTYQSGIELAKVSLREDGNRLKPNDWILISEQAALHFSKDSPREMVASVTGNGTKTYTLTGTITTWVNRFSYIQKIEYPLNSDPVAYLPIDDFMIYKSDTDTEQLKLKNVAPSAAQTFLLHYISNHTFSSTSTTTTIDDQDKIIFSILMAYYAAMAMYSDFLKPNRSSLPNDSVDFSQKAKDMSDLAALLLKKYTELLSGKTETLKSYATFTKDFDMVGRYGNSYFTVPEENR